MTAELRLHDPCWLWALLAVPAVVWLRQWRAARVLLVPFAAAWNQTSLQRPGWWPWAALVGGAVLLTVALARPQRSRIEQLPPADGCDIMLAVDVSGSMGSLDFALRGRPVNRLEAVTPIIEAFMTRRPHDRIGLVVFSGRAYTLCPPTFNHPWLARQMGRLRVGMVEEGTAIGDAIVTCLRRLQPPGAAPRARSGTSFIVLLTDGASNSGVFEPLDAALMARARGIPVYTIATGTLGPLRLPFVAEDGTRHIRTVPSEMDEATLCAISQQTGGRFFRAEWPDTVAAAFRAIDQGQKTTFAPRTRVTLEELFPWAAVPGVVLVLLGGAAAWLPGRRWVAA